MRYLVLGAEKQAATSLAAAYSDHEFLWISRSSILDGANLPNVRLVKVSPATHWKFTGLEEEVDGIVPLCPCWLDDGQPETKNPVLTLTQARDGIRSMNPEIALPVSTEPSSRTARYRKGQRLPPAGCDDRLRKPTSIGAR